MKLLDWIMSFFQKRRQQRKDEECQQQKNEDRADHEVRRLSKELDALIIRTDPDAQFRRHASSHDRDAGTGGYANS